MQKITDEQQLKINRLMNLKYKRHRKIMIRTWLFIVLYSVLVFFLLVHYHQVEYYFNWTFVILLSLSFWIGILLSIFRNGNNDAMWKSLDKSMIFFAWILVLLLIVIGSLTWVFNYDLIPIEDTFLVFVILVLGYFLLCFFWEKTITKNTLLIVYFIFYSVFLFPVLFQAITNLGFLWKLWNLLIWISPLFLAIFRSYLVDFFCSWYFIRKLFLKKDSEIWNCPNCHCHIIKKPITFCPHCWSKRYSTHVLNNSIFCNNCWFVFKVRDFDFPNYCPHCGLPFIRRKAKK